MRLGQAGIFTALALTTCLLGVGARAYADATIAPQAAATDAGSAVVHSLAPTPAQGPEQIAEQPVEVTVRGASKTDQRRQSAESVSVLALTEARSESADLGAVLARSPGITVQRAGGLGSPTRFSLQGLSDDQVRFFLDGLPLALAGYQAGVANVPVNLLDRVEVYSGVVPVRFGADALGGAVNLVSADDLRGKRLAASYELGSFETKRLALSGRYLHGPTGLLARAAMFVDAARNDYPIDVQVSDSIGRLSSARVTRFHDAYRARGAHAELGWVRRPWAKRLTLRGFLSDYDKDLQNNVVMTVPYGAASYGERTAGGSLRYLQDVLRVATLELLGGYTYARGRFLDVASCIYDWYGRCTQQRARLGETGAAPHDSLSFTQAAYGRVNLTVRVADGHTLRLGLAPTYVSRTGEERRLSEPSSRDPLSAERHLLTLVNGLEYQADLFDGRLENIAFGKQYVQQLHGEEPTSGNTFRRRDRHTQRLGLGDGVRLRLFEGLQLKASYEWATRLPSADEVFGNNVFIVSNLQLAAETSHNANLGLALELKERRTGSWRAGANAFLRDAHRLIVLLSSNLTQQYQNVYGARSRGAEASAGWTAPRDYLAVDANATYVDFRNTSAQGAFGSFVGDRIPNRPYLYANGSARTTLRELILQHDELSLSWSYRYVHSFFRTWESVGLRSSKQVIPSQQVHSVTLSYSLRQASASFVTTLEAQNLTDQRVFDVFGVQRPGRAFYLKSSAEF